MSDVDTTLLFNGDAGEGGRMAPIGALISEKWELIDHIGEGGMSDVFKARHVIMNKFGAVKFLKGKLAEDPVAVRRFQQEAMASGALSHPNIVQVYDCGLSQYGVYLIMELLEGVSLSDVLEARAEDADNGRGVLQISEALPIFLQICDGLEHAHKKGIVHRDIKPSNVMLVEPEAPKTDDPDEVQVKLVDFGIAKMAGRDGTSAPGDLTRTGEVFGSPVYMSPEQCLGRKLDGRADIYSFGCLMYESLTGGKVLSGANSTETMMRHVHEEADVSRVADIKSPQAKGLSLVIQKCLWRSPDERYSDIDDVRDALLAVDRAGSGGGKSQGIRAGHGGYAVAGYTADERKFNPLPFVLVALVLCLLAGGGIYVYSVSPVAMSASAGLVGSKPIVMPVKIPPPPTKNLAVMSARIFDGGEGIVSKLNISPERKRSKCLDVLRKADEFLQLQRLVDARHFYGFVFSIVEEANPPVPDGPSLICHAWVGRIMCKGESADLDQQDIMLGTLINDNPNYFNASSKEQRFALKKRAEVQIAKGNIAAAAITIADMLAKYDKEIEGYSKQLQDRAGLSAPENKPLQDEISDLTLQKAIWTGMLADLLRLTQDKDEQNPKVIAYFVEALSVLDKSQISDADYSSSVMIYRARLYYRYGLALYQAQKYSEACEAYRRSLALLEQYGRLLVPEIEAARLQIYFALKHIDQMESLKYRLQNHL